MKRNRIFLIIAAIPVLILWRCTKSETIPPPSEFPVNIYKNIGYIAGDTSHRHMLDVYSRQNSTLNKVVLFVPGGAWRQGDKDLYETMALTLATLYNYTVVVTNYRLSNKDDGSAIHPDHVQDVAQAFKWVMQNIAAYHGNRESLFLFGQSAGGHLASLLATDGQYLKAVGYSPKNIRGVISMSGAYSLDDLVAFPLNPLGLGAEEVLMYKSIVQNAFGSYDTAVLIPASPFYHVHDSIPPFLLIYTELDMPGFDMDAENFYDKVNGTSGKAVSINKLYQSDYSAQTWQTATELAAAEPAMAGYIGHYAEVVAINEQDHLKQPTKWIVGFINAN
jgi:acetyl esterase/lipase